MSLPNISKSVTVLLLPCRWQLTSASQGPILNSIFQDHSYLCRQVGTTALSKMNLTVCCPVVTNEAQSMGYTLGRGFSTLSTHKRIPVAQILLRAQHWRISGCSADPVILRFLKTLHGKSFMHHNFHTCRELWKRDQLTELQSWFP